MKNLKRVLSLALSGIMLVGMMAVSAGAVNAKDFTDADEITHNEAVSIFTALSIIDGKEDGSFDPAGNVTRGQMAKMITRAMFGGDDPVLGVKTVPTFTDIKGRWDESYIEYCASNSIINGRGDGTFDPEGNVTGTEAAKMLLTALGYRADIYGLVGADWALTTNSIANRTDVALYAGLKGLDPNVAFTRDQVAQMIYNALNAETMEMKPGMEITNGNVTYNYEPSGKTLLYDKYGAVRVEGVVTANEFTNNADSQKGKTRISLTNEDELTTMLGSVKANPNIEATTGKAEFGKAVYFYLKPSSSVKTDLSKGTLISDVLVSDSNVVITRTKALSGDAKTVASWLDDNGLEIGEGGDNKPAAPTYLKNYAADGKPAADSTNTVGNEFIAIDNNDDGYVDYVLQNTYAFGQVTKYNTKDKGSVTVKTDGDKTLVPTNAELKNISAYEDIAVDDFVNVTKVADTYYIAKAEIVEGELNAFKADKNVSVDGTTYDFSAQAEYKSSDMKLRGDIASNNTLGEEVTIYLDSFGYFVCGTTEAATDFLFVANVSWNNVANSLTSGTANAFVYFEDGTSGSYVINKIDDSKAGEDSAKATLGKVFKYSVTSDGKLNLTDANGAVASKGDAVEYKKGQSTLKIGSAETLITTDTVVFVVTLDSKEEGGQTVADKTIDKVNVYSSKTAPSMKYDNDADKQVVDGTDFYPGLITVVNEDDDKKSDVVVFVNHETAATGSWLYLINYNRTTSDGAEFNAIVDGEVVKIVTNDKNDRTKKGAYEYEMDGDLYVIGKERTNVATGFVTYADTTSIIVAGQEYNITKDTVTALLDDGDTEVDVTVEEKSTVVVLYNNSTDYDAEGIFVLTEAADGEAAVEATTTFVTWNSEDEQYELTAANFGDDIENVADLKAQFTISDGATAMWLAESDGSGLTLGTSKVKTDIESKTQSEDITAATYYLVVISKGAHDKDYDDGYSINKVVIK